MQGSPARPWRIRANSHLSLRSQVVDLRPCTYLYSRAWCFHQLLINQWKLWSRWWTIAHRLRLFHESQRLALRYGAAASHEDESQEADEEETHEDDEGEEETHEDDEEEETHEDDEDDAHEEESQEKGWSWGRL